VNNILIGNNAGLHFTNEKGKFIIGDDIKSMDLKQKNCVIFTDKNGELKMIIGKYINKKRCNLYDIIVGDYKNPKEK